MKIEDRLKANGSGRRIVDGKEEAGRESISAVSSKSSETKQFELREEQARARAKFGDRALNACILTVALDNRHRRPHHLEIWGLSN